MKVVYISPLFAANDERRCFMIEEKGVKYHAKRDTAVLALKALGGIDAPATKEVAKLQRIIASARRAIQRHGYFAEPVVK